MKKAILIAVAIMNVNLHAQWTDSGSTITTMDNVGIGTVSPSEIFHVVKENSGISSMYSEFVMEAQDAQLDIISNSAGTWGSAINFVEGNGSANTDVWSLTRQTTGGSGDSSFRINFGTLNRHDNPGLFIIKTNGDIGIGTNTPSSKLEVKSAVGDNSEIHINTGSDDDQSVIRFQDQGQSTWGFLSNYPSTGKFSLYNYQSSSNALVFDPNGNLSIGTTNSGAYKLAVKGKIRAEEIKVETGWADYVFEEGYDLPTLEEVEQHIKEKGRLINIPSAKEVEENGILLGEMNKLLLEKIEELTLYIVELKKENEDQFKQLEKFKEELNQIKTTE